MSLKKKNGRRRKRQRKRRQVENLRLGWRINEFSRMTGVSRITLWRLARDKKMKLAYLGTIPIITDHEARRLGLLPQEAA
jgi:hypothetical protein